MPRDCLMVCNAGSATLKVKIFKLDDLAVQIEGSVERLKLPGSTLEVSELTSGRMIRRNFPPGLPNHRAAFDALASHLGHWTGRVRAAVHRVVHGGEKYRKPTWLTPPVISDLRQLERLAPLHNPINLEIEEHVRTRFPEVPNLGVFDTAYYATMPPEAYLYALPYEYYEKYGIRRYGFHGISHQYLAEATAAKLGIPLNKLRIITCHLGSGCSVTATKYGEAVDTSMGFSPLEGLVMGTRSGDVDPAVVTFLQKTLNIGAGEVEDILNHQSGLRGLFGYSSDLRDVLTAAGYAVDGYPAPKAFTADERRRAKLALAVFVYRIVRYIGAFTTVLGGVDVLVFSGAVGERSPIVRDLVRRRLRGIPRLKTLTIHTDEALMMAKLTQRMVQRHRPVTKDVAPSNQKPSALLPVEATANVSPPEIKA
ncbi:MAG: acetate/propionate family kinase [Patescibacteria group bacterium]|nr:acetate/propionate family kinase [Patescibacteria group bacterium]